MNRTEFSLLLDRRPLLTDGGMGTLLHERGVSLEQSFDAINQSNPIVVAEVHRQYLEAGADIVQANSFGANRFKLAEHGLQDLVPDINRAAVDVARRVIEGAFREVLLAGSVGPLGIQLAPLGRISSSQAEAAFAEQIEALIQARPRGVDLLIIETISDLNEMAAAVSAARRLSLDIPIVANMTFTRDDRTLLGDSAFAVASNLGQLDVDVIGVNCSGGPAQILRLITILRQVNPDRPVAAIPNAGWPEQSAGGRVMYPANPDYFGEYALAFVEAGARILGGCCGTTSAHIAAMRRAIDSEKPSTIPAPSVELVPQDNVATSGPDQPSRLIRRFEEDGFVATVEMSPPRGIATERLVAAAQMLKEAGANCLSVADNPLARMRMSAWAAAHLIQLRAGLETILHFPTRGRNLLRIQGDLLAAYALGIRNLFVAMGDPTRIGDYPEAMDSYDIVPTGLMQLITREFNRGRDKAGNSIGHATNFAVGCALNLTAKEPAREMRLLYKKVKSGASFALTQPVFEPGKAAAFVSEYESTYEQPIIPIVAGIKPLYNGKNAQFLHHEVPGIVIPRSLRKRMKLAADPQREGVLIAQEIAQEMRPLVRGVYVMPAFGRYDLVAELLEQITKR
jgi:homocysteine S-methyltransferase